MDDMIKDKQKVHKQGNTGGVMKDKVCTNNQRQ